MSNKLSPFDIANNIYNGSEILSEDELKGAYVPFMINRVLSNNADTIFFANEMNQNYQLDPKLQYHFYFYGIEKRKRWGKWHKKSKGEQWKIDLLKETYNYSEFRAREVVPLIDQQDGWDDLLAINEKGGSRKQKRKKIK